MNYFWLNGTLLLEICIIALGLVIIHHSNKENAHLLKVAGSILLIGALILLPFTGYRWYRSCTGENCNIESGHHTDMHEGQIYGDKIWKSDDRDTNKSKTNEPTHEK